MKEKGIYILIVLVMVIGVETTLLVKKDFLTKDGGDIGVQKRLAEAYINQGLYEKAVDSYERYINSTGLALEKKSNLSYIIGDIYMDYLSDYNNALANFVRAKVYYPANSSASEINKKIVACLEKLGRSVDAEREMLRATSLAAGGKEDAPKSEEKSVIIAKIGDRKIAMRELDKEIERMPPFMRDSFKEKEKKLELLRQYITGELLYDSAKRQGLDNNKEVIENIDFSKKQLMINKLIEQEVESKLEQPGEEDLKLYYDANKDKYAEEKKGEDGKTTKVQRGFEQVKDTVRDDYMSMKRQEKIKVLLDNLRRAKDVLIFDDQIKD